MTRRLGRLAPALLCLLPFALTGVAHAAVPSETCGAELAAEMLDRDEAEGQIRFRFEVRIEANATCSALTYDFMVEEMLPNKQTKTVRKPRQVVLDGGMQTEEIEHSITDDLELLGYAVRLVDCECAKSGS